MDVSQSHPVSRLLEILDLCLSCLDLRANKQATSPLQLAPVPVGRAEMSFFAVAIPSRVMVVQSLSSVGMGLSEEDLFQWMEALANLGAGASLKSQLAELAVTGDKAALST